MDTHALRNAVFEKTGIRIDETDPVFAIVALNEAVLNELMEAYQVILSKNNGELSEMVASLVVLHRNLIEASRDLVERANQAHLTAALKAAAEARTEIMKAAKHSIADELEKAKPILTAGSTFLGEDKNILTSERHYRWRYGFVQAMIGGCVSGLVIATAQHFLQ